VRRLFNIWNAGVAWGKGLHRDAALDSLRNVLAVVGAATILADFGTIKAWLVLPMLAVAFGAWLYSRVIRPWRAGAASFQSVRSEISNYLPQTIDVGRTGTRLLGKRGRKR